jgi:E3 ubiquitin-protein ligase UBR4
LLKSKHIENKFDTKFSGMCSRQSESDESAILEENRQLLQLLAKYIVDETNPVPEEVSLTLLGCLVPQGNALLSPSSEGMPFAELMSILATLASAGSGVGHVQLFRACTEWLSTCRCSTSKLKSS